MSTNAQLGTLGIGARFRSHRNANGEWRVTRRGTHPTTDAPRVYCAHETEPDRVTDCSPSMSVWSDERQELLRTFDEYGTE